MPLAMVVLQPPYGERSARAQLDVALAAAVLELPLEIYFLGRGIWQLAKSRETKQALLPGGLKGWAALPGLTSVRFFAPPDALQQLGESGIETSVPVEEIDGIGMNRRWLNCSQVLAL
jgi:sulfur relay (sulfurtransferase) DsrF/TusC family protein